MPSIAMAPNRCMIVRSTHVPLESPLLAPLLSSCCCFCGEDHVCVNNNKFDGFFGQATFFAGEVPSIADVKAR